MGQLHIFQETKFVSTLWENKKKEKKDITHHCAEVRSTECQINHGRQDDVKQVLYLTMLKILQRKPKTR